MSDVLCGDLSDSFRVLFLQDFSKGIPATEHSPVLSGRSPAGENVLHYTHTHVWYLLIAISFSVYMVSSPVLLVLIVQNCSKGAPRPPMLHFSS